MTKVQDNGSVIITTDRGTVTARLPDNVRAQGGERVEIEIPAAPGNQNAQQPITLQVARTVEPPVSASAAPPPAPANPATHVPVRSEAGTQLELNANLRALASQDRITGPTPRQITIEPEQIVQVRQVSLAEVATILKTTPAEILSTLLPSSLGDTPLVDTLMLDNSLLATLKNLVTADLKPLLLSSANPGFSVSASILLSPETNKMIGKPVFLSPQSFPTSFPVSFEGLAAPDQMLLLNNLAPRLNMPVMQMMVEGVLPESLAFIKPVQLPGNPAPGTLPIPTSMSALSTAAAPAMVLFGQSMAGETFFALPPAFGNEAPVFYRLDVPANPLPTGNTITLLPLQNIAGGNLLSTPHRWDDNAPIQLITDLIDTLDPGLRLDLFGANARPILASTNAPQQMGAAVLFFLAAIRSGDLNGWLGDRAVDAIRRMGGKAANTIDKLGTLLGLGKDRLIDVPPGEWRSTPIPMNFQNHILTTYLHTRTERDDQQENGQGRKGQRFVLDLTFDRMGSVQMDMLYQPKKLDSILRTELPLSRAMRGVLEMKYAGAMGKTGLTGTLNFQDGLATWVTIQARGDDVRVMA